MEDYEIPFFEVLHFDRVDVITSSIDDETEGEDG